MDIINRASLLFDNEIVAVAGNLGKTPRFEEAGRVEMIREAINAVPTVSVDSFQVLLVNYARSVGAQAVIRGLRAVSDFEYELQMALVNRKLDEHMITVFLMPHEKYSYLNSSIVKELVRLNGEVSSFVPPHVEEKLLQKMRVK